MNLTLAATGVFGHAEAEFAGDKIVITYKKTTDKERGTIAQLVERAKKKGMVLSVQEKAGPIAKIVDKAKETMGIEKAEGEEVPKPVEDLMDVLMAKKGKLILSGDKTMVEQLALETVEEEIKHKRVVSEAQEDGSWKVITIGEFKPAKDPEKKQAVTSHAPIGGG